MEEKAEHQVQIRQPNLPDRRESLHPAAHGDDPWRHDADRDKHGQGRHDADRDPDDDPERGPQPSRSRKTQEAKQDAYFVPSKGIREAVLDHQLNSIFGSRAKYRKSQTREGWVISNGKKVTNDPIKQLRSLTELVNHVYKLEAAEKQRKEPSRQESIDANRRPRILPDSERVSQEAPARERAQARHHHDTSIPDRTAQLSRKHTYSGPEDNNDHDDDDGDDDDDDDQESAPPVDRESYNQGSPSRHRDSTSVRGEVYNDRRPDSSSIRKRVHVGRFETATASRQPLTERRHDNSKDGRYRTRGDDLRAEDFAEHPRRINDSVTVSKLSLGLENKTATSFCPPEKEELTQRFARLSSNLSTRRRR